MLSQRHLDWIAAVASTDIDAYAALVTADLVWIPPTGDAIVGRAAFRSWLAPFFERYAYDFAIADIRAHQTERWIAETGEFTSRMTPDSGGPAATHSGRFFMLWRREQDVWQIERYVDQGSLRAVGTAEPTP